jgi:site-specific DNA-methyltransferase (adenine-specific)
MNKLYFGDNLEVLRENIKPESVDLIYLDPPFNSNANYNVLFRSPQETTSAQAGAFMDTWIWGEEANWAFREIMKEGGGIARYIDALRSALGESDMMAYLVMMAVRLSALRGTLKPTGSLYLHCDSTASHYLKILLDAVFGIQNFRNDIIWKRTTTHSDSKTWSRVSDNILFYTAGKQFTWNIPREAYSEEYLDTKYTNDDGDGRRYMLDNMTSPSPRPNMMYEWKGFPFPEKGWRYSKETMARLDGEGRIWYPRDKDGAMDNTRRPRLKRYLDEMSGGVMGNIWTDISPVNSQAQERIGYPTQKPISLLERIIQASTREGDVVLDPFCGCGTTIEAAQRARRQWIGIDIAIHSIKVIETRLHEHFQQGLKYQIEGIPRDFESAKRLAKLNPYQFQWWANYLFNPHAIREQQKGPDRGIDGELYFPNGPGRQWSRLLTSVKGGENVGPAMVRDFARVLEREKAELGIFICLNKPTREMAREAASVGFGNTVHGDIPKLQIVAIEDWFNGKFPLLPPLQHLPSAAFSTAKRRVSAAPHVRPDPHQPELPFVFTGRKSKQDAVMHFNPRMVG